MLADDGGQSFNQVERETISAWYRQIGTGWRVWSKDKRSLVAQMTIAKGWQTRRAKYGKSGSKPRSYKQWRAERNKPPIGDDGRPIVSDSLTKPIS